jgi:hypothetical protein
MDVTREVSQVRSLLQTQRGLDVVRFRCASEAQADRIEAQLTADERNRVVFTWGASRGLFGWLSSRRPFLAA